MNTLIRGPPYNAFKNYSSIVNELGYLPLISTKTQKHRTNSVLCPKTSKCLPYTIYQNTKNIENEPHSEEWKINTYATLVAKQSKEALWNAFIRGPPWSPLYYLPKPQKHRQQTPFWGGEKENVNLVAKRQNMPSGTRLSGVPPILSTKTPKT